MWIEREGRN